MAGGWLGVEARLGWCSATSVVKLSWYSDILEVKHFCYSNALVEKMSCALEKDMQKKQIEMQMSANMSDISVR